MLLSGFLFTLQIAAFCHLQSPDDPSAVVRMYYLNSLWIKLTQSFIKIFRLFVLIFIQFSFNGSK